ncbi:hypothetical protein H0H81_009468 [Sphagnurus paluster]|uniref:C2H2-type domain-containing protein n=1 Tax=Sphagnurus paluster TaxID=117069 RepID=A0A9P7FVE4_9AGAR|nr:hypothetical protein H0H81_009468 [Sphagnurus paluster]
MDEIRVAGSDGSPYISQIGLQPPSPDPNQLELYPDFNDYSYTVGSPYSNQSELSYNPTDQLAPLFPDTAAGYDPSEYDNPHAGPLLIFDDAATSYNLEYYRSPSPAGSEDNHSRVSSASSSHTNFHSPHMTVAHSFEGLSFSSPNWHTDPLPPHKHQSPPRLHMPDQPSVIINAPDDHAELGPSLHIVPATPVTGPGAVAHSNASTPWLDSQSNSSRSPSPASHATGPAPARSPSTSPQPPFLLAAQAPRMRSKSDNALEPLNCDTDGFSQVYQQQQQPSTTSHPPTLGSNFTFGTPAPQNTTNNGYLSPEFPEFQLGGGGAGTQLRRSKSDAGAGPVNRHRGSRSEDYRFTAGDDNYLTPGTAGAYLVPPSSHVELLRQQHHQQQQQQQQQQQHQQHLQSAQFLSPSMRVPELVPLPSHTHGHGHGHSQSLSLSGMAAGARGHYRRASSGSRSERGSAAGAWGEGLPDTTAGSARVSPYPSPHASPRGRYVPLEHPGAGEEYDFSGSLGLGLVGGGGGAGGGGGGGAGSVISDNSVQGGGGGGGGGMGGVSKPNVTTGRTANASQKRRKQEATFVCPVPGCGSTFTRSFNLKGHIRSHKEEKPFQCPWPGCGKGFARQHDCKRHEQLHTNYRPFNCDGCGKQFARMDALNRHRESSPLPSPSPGLD